MSFADDTAVTRVGPRSFTAELHEHWSSPEADTKWRVST